MKRQKSYSIAEGGIIAALAVVLMLFTFFPFATYALPALAGLLMVVIVIDFNLKWAFSVYVVVSVLSLLMTPDREAAIMFIAFFGYYPILKSVFEKLSSRILEWILKFSVFNVAVVGAYYVIINFLGMPDIMGEINELGKYGLWIFLGLANVTFLVYDIAITKLITLYLKWFRPKFLRKFK